MRPFSDFEEIYREIVEKIDANENFTLNDVEIANFPFYFADLSSKTATAIGEKIISDLFRSFSSRKSIRSIANFCVIFNSFIKSTNFHRYFETLSKIFELLLKELEQFIERKEEFIDFSFYFAVLVFNLTQLYALLSTYFPEKLKIKSKKIRNLFASARNSTPAAKNVMNLSSILFQTATGKKLSLNFSWTLDEKHSCSFEKCEENLCSRQFLCKNLFDYRHILFESIVDLEEIMKFIVDLASRGDPLAIKFVADCQFSDENFVWKSFFRCVFANVAVCVECGFVFGQDRSVWLQKFAEILNSSDEHVIETTVSLTNKFFRHVRKDPWVGNLNKTGSNYVENLRNLFNIFQISSLTSFNFSSKCLLFGFCSVSTKIVDKFNIETNEKRQIFGSLAKIFIVLTDETIKQQFLMQIEAAVVRIVEIFVDFCLKSNEKHDVVIDLILEFFQKLVKNSNFFNECVMNSILEQKPSMLQQFKFIFSTISLFLNETKCSSDMILKVDGFIYDLFRQNRNAIREILPCLSILFSYKRKFCSSVELVNEKRIHKTFSTVVQTLDSCDFELFRVCINFLADNDDAASLSIQHFSSKLVLWLTFNRSNMNVVDLREEKNFGRNLGKLLKFLSVGELRRVFVELRENLDWLMTFSKHILGFFETEGETCETNLTDVVKTEFSLIVDILPLWMSFKSTERSDFVFVSLQFVSALIRDKSLNLRKKRLVSSVITSVSTLNLSKIDDFERIFDLVTEILNDVLKYFPKMSLKFVGNVTNLVSKLFYELVFRSSVEETNENCNYFRSAQKFSRLISTISSFSTDYKNVAPYLISDFVDVCRRWPTTKKKILDVLLVGVYDLLDLCDEHAISLLATNLNDSSKNIFRVFYEDYQKYFKYKGYV